MIDVEDQANIDQHIVTYTAPRNFCTYFHVSRGMGHPNGSRCFIYNLPLQLQLSLSEASESPAAARRTFHDMNLSEKADALSKTSCYHSDFYGMQFPVHWPVIFLPNKHMFHVKRIATNIDSSIRSVRDSRDCWHICIDVFLSN